MATDSSNEPRGEDGLAVGWGLVERLNDASLTESLVVCPQPTEARAPTDAKLAAWDAIVPGAAELLRRMAWMPIDIQLPGAARRALSLGTNAVAIGIVIVYSLGAAALLSPRAWLAPLFVAALIFIVAGFGLAALAIGRTLRPTRRPLATRREFPTSIGEAAKRP